ncbi:PrkA family serine protein kinase [Salinarchaeum sp. IM2453]|uniref:PrkA family serine protein kinase n=1 Tax=Salinarchaeum sp. IM2453 TaxID=2862870 RepID=UPI002106C5D7|nr:kinase anchor protein [Salinarchaeum sp. IM2453]
MTDGSTFISASDDTLQETYDEPMSLAEYVETLLESPKLASHAAKYLLDAIEAAGTRTVVEEGEEKQRYRFFDDPSNDGEHAVLGNTETLNAFVDDLRSIATGRGKGEKMIWFAGPTATGKSELKRCLVNGLREYSKTPAGRRYTLEWNIKGVSESRGLSYGSEEPVDEDDWYQSPVQVHPLAVFPESVREDILAELDLRTDDHTTLRLNTELDPFSREAYSHLEEQYRRQEIEDLFSQITDPKHLRVKNYVVDVGRGIGVLHAEDDGSAKERLVGTWMPGMLQELDSRGRKNPQAFSYDGVLSQGNSGLTIVEDAAQHADLLQKLLNVPDEKHVKLDTGIGMEIDTQIIVISNPDLEATLNQHADRQDADPLKALKRRLDRHEFAYLTNLSLEAQLIRRELTNETAVWEADDYNDLDEKIVEPVQVDVQRNGWHHTKELAPHTIEAAALYSVVTRLEDEDLPSDLDLVDKALLFDRGYLVEDDTRRTKDDIAVGSATNGRRGIPVTYTRDTFSRLLQEETDRSHPEYDVEDVIMPRDILNQMADGLRKAPVFSSSERSEFESRVAVVKNYIFDRQADDVITAMTHNESVDPELVEAYVEHVYAWGTDEVLTNDRGERIGPDQLRMKIFEIEHLGRFSEDDYRGNEPTSVVKSFRREQVINALNRRAWEQRGEDFAVSDVDLTEIPIIRSVLQSNDWEDIARRYDDFDPNQWDDPPADTQTEQIKERAIENMIELFDYTPASAELTSRHVMNEVSYKWD